MWTSAIADRLRNLWHRIAPHLRRGRQCGPHFDDGLTRKAVQLVEPGDYAIVGNNCQDWADDVRKMYFRLVKARGPR